jgi:hypothetical protein
MGSLDVAHNLRQVVTMLRIWKTKHKVIGVGISALTSSGIDSTIQNRTGRTTKKAARPVILVTRHIANYNQTIVILWNGRGNKLAPTQGAYIALSTLSAGIVHRIKPYSSS